jgi:hypothetical protein
MVRPVLAIGWDVGGWRGTRQGLATVSLSPEGGFTVRCLPRSRSLADLAQAGPLEDFVHFVAIASGDVAAATTHRVVLAMDAPFGFPAAFQRLANRTTEPVNLSAGILANPYAFRRTDVRISERFKMPLSASFDKLGNNATVAMHYLSSWRAQGLRVLPFDTDDGRSPVALEVYPAVAGPARGIDPNWLDPMQSCSDGTPDPHQRDALICAGLAMAYAHPGHSRLPRLEGAEPDMPEGEGWIFAPVGRWEAPPD